MFFFTAIFVAIANSHEMIPNKNMTVPQELVTLPATFYLDQLESASTDYRQALYYYVELCDKAVASRKQAVLKIYEGDNPEWNTTYHPYIVVQVSKCENNFTKECVIATNYDWGSGINVKAISNISWTLLSNETDKYWIRVMGQYKASEFSMELSFNDTANSFSYPWTTNNPFMTEKMTISPQPMLQYWKASGEFTTDNDIPVQFAIGYCDQSGTIKGIDISVTAKLDTNDYSLIQQWACPQTININDCTNTYASTVGWANAKIASFNLLQCINIDGSKTTADGIWVFVVGNGANLNNKNTFSFYATQHE